MESLPKTRLSREQLERNFADYHPALTRDEAVAEASRCLFCFDAPCTRACPTHIDVPRFIRQILHDNPAGAAETILEENIFGGSCARACPTEVLCEGACVDRTLLNEPVQIGRLQRYATDYATAHGLRFFSPGPDTGKHVGIVGAGPAGLSCSFELRKLGHRVTVFEARNVAGGLNTLGIAPYKISTEFALTEIEPIREMGVDIRLNSPIDGRRFREMQDRYDAVFLGIGLGSTAGLGVPGEDLDGVVEALDFIFQAHHLPMDECRVGQNVVVIGAGNTAVDVATQAVRLGAQSVTIAYRRTDAEMPAFQYEYELAKADGVSFLWKVRPIEFIGENGRLSGIRLESTDTSPSGTDAIMVLPCDMVVKALGQLPLTDFLQSLEGIAVESGRLMVDAKTGQTDVRGVFAGGDCISKGAEIVDAVQEGKIAARGIHEYVTAIR